MLRKLYFDAVSPEGDWSIAYRVEFSLFGMGLCYEELSGDAMPRPWSRLTPAAAEARHRFGPRDASAEWTLPAPAFRHELETEVLHWRLTGAGRGFSGPVQAGDRTAYSEDLRLKVNPWALGLRTLRWGRVADDGLLAVWIIGDGPRPIRYAAINGDSFDQGVDWRDDTLRTPAGEVGLGDTLRVISQGDVRPVRSRLAQAISRLAFGGGGLQQDKASRLCEVRLAGQPPRRAVAIAETVRFGG